MTTNAHETFDLEPAADDATALLGTGAAETAAPESVAPETPPSRPGLADRIWSAFTHWRRSRPFWGALLLCLGAYFIFSPIIGGSITMLIKQGAVGMAGYVIGATMVAAALTSVIAPSQRHFPAIIATIASVSSLPLSNLGGWFLGLFCGIVGSAMIFAWTPYTEKDLAKYAARAERKAARRAAKAARPA